jgi:hypothetical protein
MVTEHFLRGKVDGCGHLIGLPVLRIGTGAFTRDGKLAHKKLQIPLQFHASQTLKMPGTPCFADGVRRMKFGIRDYPNPMRQRGIAILRFGRVSKDPSLTLRVLINPQLQWRSRQIPAFEYRSRRLSLALNARYNLLDEAAD